MEQLLTIVCKLQPSAKQAEQIDALLQAFSDGCTYANQTVKAGVTSKTTIQSLVYQELREKFQRERKSGCKSLRESWSEPQNRKTKEQAS